MGDVILILIGFLVGVYFGWSVYRVRLQRKLWIPYEKEPIQWLKERLFTATTVDTNGNIETNNF